MKIKLYQIRSPMLRKKPVNTHDTVVRVCSVLQCAKMQHRTHTRDTHFGNTAGLPVPMFNPTDLQKWMFKATSEEITVQRAHVREEFLEEREDDEKRAQ